MVSWLEGDAKLKLRCVLPITQHAHEPRGERGSQSGFPDVGHKATACLRGKRAWDHHGAEIPTCAPRDIAQESNFLELQAKLYQ